MTQPQSLPAGEPKSDDDLPRMTLLEHLEELRTRILHAGAAILVGFFVCFAFARQIYDVLALPIKPFVPKLSFLRVTDPFVVYVKVAFVAALFLTSPFILYQVWRFVAPGLYRREKRYAIPFMLFGSSFFLAGGVFGYFVAWPFAVEFLINLGEAFTPVITVDFYFNSLITVLLGLGVMFELPVFIFLLAQIGVVTPKFLMRNFRWAVLAIFLIAAIITPTPDVVNLLVVALPTVLLYLVGVGAAAIAVRKKE